MVYVYLVPLLLVAAFFLSTVFVIGWLSKAIIYLIVFVLSVGPFYLLYLEEKQESEKTSC